MSNGMDIVKWGRFFALYDGEELICVTVYRRGAEAVKKRIEELRAIIQNLQTNEKKGDDLNG
jgi:hypothetical protein